MHKSSAQNTEPFFGYSTLKFNGSSLKKAQFSIFLDNRKSELSSVSDVFFVITDEQNNVISTKGTLDTELKAVANPNGSYPQRITTNSVFISDLKENTNYKASMAVKFKVNAQSLLEKERRIYIANLCEESTGNIGPSGASGVFIPCQKIGNEISFRTGSNENPTTGTIEDRNVVAEDYPDTGFNFDCGVNNMTGCLAGFFYAIFIILAKVVEFVAKILDFFVFYSLNNSSYSGDFIGIAWGSVRDIANIFFIVALLYASIQTILGLGAGKKIIANIVIIALLINFSLFVSQAVIDTSNIIAKVFYNNMDVKEKTGEISTGQAGEKTITVSLLGLVNPQKMFNQESYSGNEGFFSFVALMSIVMLVYFIYIFLSISLLFLGRVATLWMYMVFSPIAFASYVLPFEIPGLGHKEWWSKLFQAAFMAPVFIFFLYVILLFKPAFETIQNIPKDSNSLMNTMMGVVIPFAIMYLLLSKAKDTAVSMSGELGAKIAGISGSIAKLATAAITGGAGLMAGAAMGGVGMVGRRLGGRLGDKVQGWGSENGNWAQRGLYGAGKKMSTGSWDPRAVSVAGFSLASAGVVGKGQQGGWDKMKEDKDKRHQARAKELAENASESERKEKEKIEIAVLDAEIKHAQELANYDKKIEEAKEALANAPDSEKAQKRTELQDAKDKKKDGLSKIEINIPDPANPGQNLSLSAGKEAAKNKGYEIKNKEKEAKQEYADKIVNKAWGWTGEKERREETANKIRLGSSEKKDDNKK